ncbi:MAG: DUF805 domain-containing protein [Actinomycetota bacterium]|nr:DUF805 domain-containing protein [Actinomycetota bacterium]
MDNIDWADLLFKFDGRINRGKFWLGLLAMWVVVAIVAMIAGVVNNSIVWAIFGLLYLFVIWPSLAINIKRWHDRGKSGWWILISFIPLIGPIWALIEVGFLPGTPGTNEYGPDPLAGV